MRALIALLMMTTSAGATVCSTKDGAPITISGWSAEKAGEATISFSLNLQVNLPQPARMLDGYVVFHDSLGKDMGAISLPMDREYSSGELELTVKAGSKVVPRILSVSMADIVAQACVASVIYEDGSVEQFK